MTGAGGERRGGGGERGQRADEDENEAGAHRRARLATAADGARRPRPDAPVRRSSQPPGAWNITEAADGDACSSVPARARTSGAVALTGVVRAKRATR